MMPTLHTGSLADALLPRLALSVRQPWAHALAMGWKPVENRSWRVITPQRQHIGFFCIHASKGMTRAEYEDGRDFIEDMGFECPPAAELQRGGIVGIGRMLGIVRKCDSPWFFGPKGLLVSDAYPIQFIPSAGKLYFFEWKPGGEAVPPAKWMLDAAVVPLKSPQGMLL
ncbi:hypothetical protein [Aquamicrobium defluvii]|uniref:ASCH domain-containing protein n=1 Tax=Aquamicrobium defluvii TaxID=69279 RepID=A0A4R6YH01_9HYPH|nr:hypothetical protein [Aquamicrobium defluvii]TDR35711.1 hypothetical protein DES43_108136 [Aquamicrobium defluvii]